MVEKTLSTLVSDYNRTRALYKDLREHFERFCISANSLQKIGSPVEGEGIEVATENGALSLKFLDRHIRVSMRLDRQNRKGVLHVEDRSAEGIHQAAQTITLIPYNEHGESQFGRGEEGHIDLNLEQDRMTLALSIIDIALDHDPWHLKE